MGSSHRPNTESSSKCNIIGMGMRRLIAIDNSGGRLERSMVHVPGGRGEISNKFVQRRRKSLPHMEMNVADVAAMIGVKVMEVDMAPFMQLHAIRCARRVYDSLDKFSSRQMAHDIKKEFDKVYGATWHCIVGTSFGSFVTHSNGCFLYFSMDKVLVMLFKTKIRFVTS